MDDKKNKFLICIDGSYASYFILFGAASEFQKRYPEVASTWIKPPEECDQQNLPNLLNCEEFKKILKQFTMKRLETIEWIAKENFQDEIDIASGIDVIFAMDDRPIRNEKHLFTFSVTDFTDSIVCKVFVFEEHKKDFESLVKAFI